MEPSLDELLGKASALAGRSVEVERTKDGSYIVLYMCFGKRPPPKAKNPAEALTSFITYMEENRSVDPGKEEDLKELQERLEAEEKEQTREG